MFKKFEGLTDENLVLMYKDNREEDVELELIERYKIHSKKLAGEVFKKFKFLYQVEFEDIYCIALGSLFIAIRVYKPRVKSFFGYWRTTAMNEINEYLSDFTLIKDENGKKRMIQVESSKVNYLKQPSTYSSEDFLLTYDIQTLLDNPIYKFKDIDKAIFNMFLSGYSSTEIADELHIVSSTVRYHLKNIKSKIGKILANLID